MSTRHAKPWFTDRPMLEYARPIIKRHGQWLLPSMWRVGKR